MIIAGDKISQAFIEDLQTPLELDLIALFKVLEEQMLLATANTNQTPEQMIDQILSFLKPNPKSMFIGKSKVLKEDRAIKYILFQGLTIGIESPKGTFRSGVSSNGHSWKNMMFYDYGFIVNIDAIDGDSLDVYIGPNEDSDKVFVVKQVNPSIKEFDEYKIMLGFLNKNIAVSAYKRQYDSPEFFGGITEYSLDSFKEMIFGGNYAKSEKR